MFIFYDIETTGTNIAFDQILQFAAILTDEHLNEIERFESRCQLLPWVVPSPIAMLVTKTPVSALRDKTLPTFFAMMSAIHKKMSAWSPATYIGYNSLAFDEQFLHRALWQTLYPPYITVTNNNKRCDLLQMIRTASYFFPESFIWPRKKDGQVTLKLDQLAPINGFNHTKAHDALNDVEATLFLAKKLSEKLPNLWPTLLKRSQKTEVSSLVLSGKPFLLFETVKGKASSWFGQNLESDRTGSITQTLVAKLGYDWAKAHSSIEALKIDEIQKNTRMVAFNKAPTLFSLEEAKKLFNLELSDEELSQSTFLSSDKIIPDTIITIIKSAEKIWPVGEELEQKIYEAFPSKEDEKLALAFRNAEGKNRAEIAEQFGDQKYRQLALRLLFLERKDLLKDDEILSIQAMIHRRFYPEEDKEHAWRSISDALKELIEPRATELGNAEQIYQLKQWLLEQTL